MACLLGGVAWLVGRSGRQAWLAHCLWLLLFVKLITPPLITVPVPLPDQGWFAETVSAASSPRDNENVVLTEVPPAESNASVPLDTPATTAAGSPRANGWSRLDWWHGLLFIWLGGFLWIAVRGAIKLLRFYRLVRQNGTVDPQATRFVRDLLDSAGDSTSPACSPQVILVPLRVSPMLLGFGRRTYIVCPGSLWDAFEDEQRQAFLAHEAAHFRRRDHWGRWLEWSVTAVYWWFPLVYLARRQLERHEEACCDAWAVRMLATSPRQYAEALLEVVDFISDYQVGMVRLASGMQPTYTLEERLHLIMKGGPSVDQARHFQRGVMLACGAFCLLHPIVKFYRPQPEAPQAVATNNISGALTLQSQVVPSPAQPKTEETLELPPVPQGFWNQKPKSRWADVSLSLPGARLVAEASDGIRFVTATGKTLRFQTEELTAVAEIAATKRVVIGDQQGQLRLWDLAARMPVSLIGQHPAPVTSVAYHEHAGILSADEAGSVMRWDLQSGQVLATWSEASLPIQSIRLSADGQTLAILCGQWEDLDQPQQLYFVESQSLKPIRQTNVFSGTAVVAGTARNAWLAVHWSGVLFDPETGLPLGQLPKHEVSALVLCQDSPLPQSVAERESP
ncbi:M56 family metallopeptidase [Bremerella cremea]|nr:M56 family metallopeptidase [Bremerella cremea]